MAVLLSVIADDSRTGKTDARIGASLETAIALYDEALDEARTDARVAGRDEALTAAMRAGDDAAAAAAAASLRRELGLASLIVLSPDGDELASAGARDGVASAELEVRGPEGPIGSLAAASLPADRYAAQVAKLTARDVAVARGQKVLASTADLGDAELPAGEGGHDVELPAGGYRVAAVSPGGADPALRLAVLSPREDGGFLATPPLVAARAGGVLRRRRRLRRPASAHARGPGPRDARRGARVGEGDFSRKVPVEGDDEMAGLASEFNKMSDRLRDQMEELRRQQVELDRSVRRIGEAFAAGPRPPGRCWRSSSRRRWRRATRVRHDRAQRARARPRPRPASDRGPGRGARAAVRQALEAGERGRGDARRRRRAGEPLAAMSEPPIERGRR